MFKKLTLLAIVLFIPQLLIADDYNINAVIGDGSSGRPFNQWVQALKEGPVSTVSITISKKSGGNDAYVNLRFKGGGTFENGRRVAVGNNEQTVTWRVNGERPNGRPLILNAYKGSFYVKNAVVKFQGGGGSSAAVERPTKPRPKPRPIPGRPNDNIDNVDKEALALCRDPNKRIRRPRIELDRVKPSGGLFSGKYRISGMITGQCIEEAGYFEGSRIKDKIDIPLNDRFDRHEFSFQVRGGRRGEIRVYAVDGSEDTIEIDEEIKDYERNR